MPLKFTFGTPLFEYNLLTSVSKVELITAIMSIYAVLGATGNCGAAVTELLLQTDDSYIHAYCRNKQKLIKKIPQIVNNDRVKIFEGSIHDHELLAECIRGAKAIFHMVTTNENVPGYSTGQETAESIVSALERLEAECRDVATHQKPKVILLSSGTIDDRICHVSPILRSVLLTAFSSVYEDLRKTETFLRSKSKLVTTVFIKPGGLALDVQRGHQLSLDHDESFVSYLDLACGMIEVANDDTGRYDMQNVSVNNKDGSAGTPDGLGAGLALGLLRHFFPFMHEYLPLTC